MPRTQPRQASRPPRTRKRRDKRHGIQLQCPRRGIQAHQLAGSGHLARRAQAAGAPYRRGGDPGGGVLRRYAVADRRARERPRAGEQAEGRVPRQEETGGQPRPAPPAAARDRYPVRRAAAATAEPLADGRAARRHQPGGSRPRPAVRFVQAGPLRDGARVLRGAADPGEGRRQLPRHGRFRERRGAAVAHRHAERRVDPGRQGRHPHHGCRGKDLPLSRRRGSGGAAQVGAGEERPLDDPSPRPHRAIRGRRRAWRLRRGGARRSEAGACGADEGRARARRAAAAGQALRAGALYGGGADRPVPSRAHRRRGGRQPRRRQQARARSEPAEGAARVVSAGVDPDARHDHPEQGGVRAGQGRPEPLPRAKGELHGPELRSGHGHRRRRDQPEGAGPGQRRGMGGAHQRAATGGGQTMNTKTMKAVYGFALWLAAFGLATAQSNSIESFEVTQVGGKTIVRSTTKDPLRNVPPNFAVASPARIAFDFPNTVNALGRASQDIGQGELRSMNLVQGSERTRLVLNLRRPVAHEASLDGGALVISLSEPAVAQTAPGGQIAHFAEGKAEARHAIRDVDFRRGRAGEGRVVVDLSDTSTGIDIRQQGQNIIVEFIKTALPDNLRRRLDVIDFGTPVTTVSTFPQGENVRMVIEPKGQWEHNAYQTDTQFVVEVKPVVADPSREGQRGRYTGEKLSLNFQNVEVRAVLNVIADFTDLNIITSDTVTGNITLRLKDVPWDQALEIILQTRGLDSRRSGNVVWIAPRDELATREKLALEATQQISDLEQTRTEAFQMNYQKAADVQKLLSDPSQRILSKRGSAVVDARTNTLFIQDTPSHLEEVRRLIAKIDVAVRQVMIEARIVEANDSFSKNLGVRFGYAETQNNGRNIGGLRPVIGAELLNTQQLAQLPTATTPSPTLSSPQGVQVGLPATGFNNFQAGQLSFVLFNQSLSRTLSLELSALEADGKGKIISSPRVLTANQVEALIEQGTEIPYQQASSSGATTTGFRKANLALKVKPQSTPDDNIIMTLDVNKDQVGATTPAGVQINTKHVKTEVLVENGGTVVIGGIYEQNDRTDITKVPVLGDLPVIGWLFKNTTL